MFKHLKLSPVLISVILVLLAAQDNSQLLEIGIVKKYSNSLKIHTNELDITSDGLYLNFVHFSNHLEVVNSMYASTGKLHAQKGSTHDIKGIYNYTNLSYIKLNFGLDRVGHSLTLGRNYFDFGTGKANRLFFSRESRPFDQLNWHYDYKNVSGGLVGIQLENTGNIKRYLTAHTFQFEIPDKFRLLWGEAILYTGVNRSVEWQFFNPFLLWTPEIYNGTTGDANGFLYSGLEINCFPTWQFWGELLVDDYQINKEKKSDLEPNEIGIVVGIQKLGFPFANSVAWLEYTRITNRTYQTPKPEETYTHRGFPIGHYLGNDFDLLQFHYEQKLGKSINVSYFSPEETKLYLNLGYLREGANGMDTPFDTPWEDSTVTMGTGYSEPFPTGPITYITELETGLDFYFKNGSYLNIGMFLQRQEFHEKVDYNYSLVLRVWFNLSKKFNY